MNNESLIVVGRIGAPYGVQGWSHVTSYTDPDSNLTSLKQLQLRSSDNTLTSIEEIEFRRHNHRWITKVNQSETRDQATQFRGQELVIHRTNLPELDSDEVYWIDLLGVRVINKEEVELGQVTEVNHNGSSPVMTISKDDTTYMIPLVDNLVLKIDTPKLIQVDWHESWVA